MGKDTSQSALLSSNAFVIALARKSSYKSVCEEARTLFSSGVHRILFWVGGGGAAFRGFRIYSPMVGVARLFL